MKRNLTIGVDVSKSSLDLVAGDANWKWSEIRVAPVERIPNTQAAIAMWLSRVTGGEIRVVFEATGTYSDKLKQALLRHGVGFSVADTLQAKNTAQSLKIGHRNDQTSAQVLAYMGNHLDLPPYQAPTAHAQERKQLISALAALEKEHRMVSNRLLAHQQYDAPTRSWVRSISANLNSWVRTSSRWKQP